MTTISATRNFFYKKISVSALTFPNKPQVEIPFSATHIILTNDSDKEDVTFSFLKPNIDGELFKKESPITFDGVFVDRLWFLRSAGNTNAQVRIWAWRK